MRYTPAALLCVLLLSFTPRPAGADWAVFSPAVFLLVTDNLATEAYDWLSTAFFIDDHGTALTTTHSVRHVLEAPERYQLLAILPDHTLRRVKVICANSRILDSYRRGREAIGRDVAIIQVLDESPNGSADFKGVTVADHSDMPLGVTPFLPLSKTTPSSGSLVHMVGYGYRGETPHQYQELGYVESLRADNPDHAEILGARLTIGRVAAGDSGGPFLDATGHVVGIFAWLGREGSDAAYGVATPDVRCGQ